MPPSRRRQVKMTQFTAAPVDGLVGHVSGNAVGPHLFADPQRLFADPDPGPDETSFHDPNLDERYYTTGYYFRRCGCARVGMSFAPGRRRRSTGSPSEFGRFIQSRQLPRVSHHVDPGDPTVLDDEAHRGAQLPVELDPARRRAVEPHRRRIDCARHPVCAREQRRHSPAYSSRRRDNVRI